MTALGRPPAAPGTLLCPRCGSALRAEPSWCLECGLAARTRVHPPPNWRVPVVLTCVLLALLAAGIAVALVTLLDTPESAPAPTTVTVPAASTPPVATTPTATVPTTTVPTTPSTTTAPTTPSTAVPTTTTPTTTAPGAATTSRTFTIPGTRIRLPATGTR